MSDHGVFHPISDHVRLITLWSRWAALVASGAKPLETRTWAWPYGPGWLGICAARRYDGHIDGLRAAPFPEAEAVMPGAIVALVFVTGCRPLVPADLPRSLIYAKGLFAWELTHVRRLTPIPMARCPQKFARAPRSVIERALGHHGVVVPDETSRVGQL